MSTLPHTAIASPPPPNESAAPTGRTILVGFRHPGQTLAPYILEGLEPYDEDELDEERYPDDDEWEIDSGLSSPLLLTSKSMFVFKEVTLLPRRESARIQTLIIAAMAPVQPTVLSRVPGQTIPPYILSGIQPVTQRNDRRYAGVTRRINLEASPFREVPQQQLDETVPNSLGLEGIEQLTASSTGSQRVQASRRVQSWRADLDKQTEKSDVAPSASEEAEHSGRGVGAGISKDEAAHGDGKVEMVKVADR